MCKDTSLCQLIDPTLTLCGLSSCFHFEPKEMMAILLSAHYQEVRFTHVVYLSSPQFLHTLLLPSFHPSDEPWKIKDIPCI